MRSFIRGFRFAFEGIIHCIKNERNMRIHTVAALYVLIFARFFAFSKTEYAILLLTIGGVLSAEAMNTAVENLADKITKEKHPHIKAAKDAAAGAVLILAVFAVGIAALLFGNVEGFREMYYFYTTHPINLAAIIILAVISLVYIIAGPSGIFKKK
ncbi:MAG: diacylglycerol kinase family protein [Clostridia bacterium]|nr:diacylglycerol kinase family protein [Clostridia bacterium]